MEAAIRRLVEATGITAADYTIDGTKITFPFAITFDIDEEGIALDRCFGRHFEYHKNNTTQDWPKSFIKLLRDHVEYRNLRKEYNELTGREYMPECKKHGLLKPSRGDDADYRRLIRYLNQLIIETCIDVDGLGWHCGDGYSNIDLPYKITIELVGKHNGGITWCFGANSPLEEYEHWDRWGYDNGEYSEPQQYKIPKKLLDCVRQYVALCTIKEQLAVIRPAN